MNTNHWELHNNQASQSPRTPLSKQTSQVKNEQEKNDISSTQAYHQTKLLQQKSSIKVQNKKNLKI